MEQWEEETENCLFRALRKEGPYQDQCRGMPCEEQLCALTLRKNFFCCFKVQMREESVIS
jgi:hypothetical protein